MKGLIRRWFKRIVFVAGGVFLAAVVHVWGYALDDPDKKSTVAVVLGAAAWNGRPSPVLKGRIEHAIALYQHQDVETLLLTGGVGTNDTDSEGEVSARFAMAQGVPEKDILIENRSRSTLENLCFSLLLLNTEKLKNVLIVSDPFHVYRGVYLARQLGLNAEGAATPSSRFTSVASQAKFLLRETYFVLRLWYQRLLNDPIVCPS